MADAKYKEAILSSLVDKNQITVGVLGICSALAVTSILQTAAVMALAVVLVTGCSNAAVSMFRLPYRVCCCSALWRSVLLPMIGRSARSG